MAFDERNAGAVCGSRQNSGREGRIQNDEGLGDRTSGTEGTAEEQRLQTAATTEEVARSAFALLQKLEMDAPLKAPSVLTVFRLYCVDGHSADRVARKCRGAKGTVMSRLRFIEERTGLKPEQFREMSGHFEQIDDDLRTSGAKEIYRKGLASEDEPGKWD
ncbi:MAG: hypothetical protein U1F83_19685 [Verrucomicrobiota bacterium]